MSWVGSVAAPAPAVGGDTGRRLVVWVLMVGNAVAEERQLHNQSRIVAMNTSYNAARSGTNSHEYVALRRTVWRCDGPCRPGRGANSLNRREQLSLERGGGHADVPSVTASPRYQGVRAWAAPGRQHLARPR